MHRSPCTQSFITSVACTVAVVATMLSTTAEAVDVGIDLAYEANLGLAFGAADRQSVFGPSAIYSSDKIPGLRLVLDSETWALFAGATPTPLSTAGVRGTDRAHVFDLGGIVPIASDVAVVMKLRVATFEHRSVAGVVLGTRWAHRGVFVESGIQWLIWGDYMRPGDVGQLAANVSLGVEVLR